MARPKKNRNREAQFRDLMLSGLDERGESLYWLANEVGADFSTISQVAHDGRPCPEHLKLVIFNAIQASEDQKFWMRSTSDEYRGLYVPDTGTSPLQLILNRAIERLFRAQYDEALMLCDRVVDESASEDHLDRADAHSRVAWTFFEMGRASECMKATTTALAELRKVFNNASVATILTSLAGSGTSALLSREERSTAVLQDILHLVAKFRTERVVHVSLKKEERDREIEEAKHAFVEATLLDDWVGDDQKSAHTCRWHAVLLAGTGARSSEKAVRDLLDASRRKFRVEENGPVYLERDLGLAALFQDRFSVARKHLTDAVPLFAKFNDPRGLGVPGLLYQLDC